jgi:hypothetical protein
VRVEGNAYVKDTKSKCDNWLWAPLGIVDVHQPERWGYVQFATGRVNATQALRDPDWVIRSVAMQVYYAEVAYAAAHNGSYTDEAEILKELAPLGAFAVNGSCTRSPTITLTADGGYTAEVAASDGARRVASITHDRYLLVT